MNGSKERKQRQLDLNKRLGKRLAAIRHERGLNQQHVAECMDVKRTVISKIENGYRALGATELSDYAHALGIHTFELFEIVGSIVQEYDGR